MMLSDVKILDFTTLLPGPFATMYLADLGAKILRVEAPGKIDLVKNLAPKVDGISVVYHVLHRNKSVVEIDLKTSTGIEQVKQLVREYDVVIEGFRPGVMKKLGLDYDSLIKLNDKLIYCSITGFGQDGPLVNTPDHDINYLALAGTPPPRNDYLPVPHNLQIADIAGGSLHTVIGVLSAYINLLKTGTGQFIDIAMYDATISLSMIDLVRYLATKNLPNMENGLLTGGTIYDYYQTHDGRFLSIGSLEPKFRMKLFHLLAIDPEGKSEFQLKEIIRDLVKTKTLEYWISIFSRTETCVEPVLNFHEVVNHPQFVHRDLIGVLETSEGNVVKYIKNPIRFSAKLKS
ncbi:MAG: CoA transferase [Candidatus Heimdallarchaeota archaeon]|nr:CoA transferase [Candidatus Heimdallarchaeota archaeon]